MITLAAITATVVTMWASPTQAEAITGPVTHYRAGLMELVAVNRGIITDVHEYTGWLSANGYAGMVALERAGDLFRDVWIGGGRYYVADCRARHHYPGGHVVEVDYDTAVRWLAAGDWPDEVEVRFEPEPDLEQWRGEVRPI